MSSSRCASKPAWLARRLPRGPAFGQVSRLLRQHELHTVCQEALCPNRWECFSNRTATFLLLGPDCTRDCRFCAVGHGPKGPPDPEEPDRVARAAADLQLDYVVLTSVTRDDLPDGGAGAFARTIQRLRQALPGVGVEVLVPDFQGDPRALDTVLGADPDVFNHNLETVPRLCPAVRPQASVARSLEILGRAAAARPAMPVKSGLMLGLGETEAELLETFDRLVAAGCSLLTLGQYLQPTPAHLPVASYLPPEAFDRLQHLALERGFAQVISGPLVRSSYQAKALAARDRLEARDSTQPLDPPPAPG